MALFHLKKLWEDFLLDWGKNGDFFFPMRIEG
jgi:hypothetical protein